MLHNALSILDAILLAVFTAPGDPLAGYWLGCAVLAAASAALGAATAQVWRFFNHGALADLGEQARRRHEEAMAARRAGDLSAYEAANKLANDAFGRWFFQSAAAGISELWPVFLAAAWLAQRFDRIAFPLPWTDLTASFVAPLVLCFLALRLLIAFTRRPRRPATCAGSNDVLIAPAGSPSGSPQQE